jgi:hypothetical protein
MAHTRSQTAYARGHRATRAAPGPAAPVRRNGSQILNMRVVARRAHYRDDHDGAGEQVDPPFPPRPQGAGELDGQVLPRPGTPAAATGRALTARALGRRHRARWLSGPGAHPVLTRWTPVPVPGAVAPSDRPVTGSYSTGVGFGCSPAIVTPPGAAGRVQGAPEPLLTFCQRCTVMNTGYGLPAGQCFRRVPGARVSAL